MTSRLKLTAFALVLAIAMTLVGMFISSGPKSPASSPYQSALSSVGVANAEAANPHRCTNRICEFASPGYICGDAFGSNCVLSGGCSTVTCPGR
jgi:hypothetical protein